MDPIDRAIVLLRAKADQLRAGVRDAFLGMDRSEMRQLMSTCATGDLSDLDERTTSLVAWLALVAMHDLIGLAERSDA